MSNAARQENSPEPHPRRGRWRRRVLWAFLSFVLLVALVHRPLLQWGVQAVAIRVAARENVKLSFEVEGSVWRDVTIKNLRAVPMGMTSVESIAIERLRIEYNLWSYLRNGSRDAITVYQLQNAELVLDSIKGSLDQRRKVAQVLRDILQQPAMYSDRAQIENINLTVHAPEGTYVLKGVDALLDPAKPGDVRIKELSVPKIGSWHDVNAKATYINRHLVLRNFDIGDVAHVARLELDSSHRDKGVRLLSFEGTVFGGDLGLYVWQKELASGELEAQLTAYLHDMPMAALGKYAEWKIPVTGNLKEAWVQITGDPLIPKEWKGNVAATIENGTVSGYAVEKASGKVTLKDGKATFENVEFSTGKNRLELHSEHPLPESFDVFCFSGLDAVFSLDCPELSSIHAAFVGGKLQGSGHILFNEENIVIEGKVSASGVNGKDFGIKMGSSDFQVKRSLALTTLGKVWFNGFTGHVRLDAEALRFQKFAANHLLLDLPVDGKNVQGAKLLLDIDEKDKMEGEANLSLAEPYAYEARLVGKVQDMGIFQPFIETTIGGELDIAWHGTGEIQQVRHNGEGRIALRHGRIERFTNVEGEIAGSYSPEKMDITALHVTTDQGAVVANVQLRDERLHVDGLQLAAGNYGIVTGSFSLPLDLRAPTRPGTVFPLTGALEANLKLEQFDLAKVVSSFCPEMQIRGAISGSLTAGGTLGSPELTSRIVASNLQSESAQKLAPAEGEAVAQLKKGWLFLSGSMTVPGLSALSFKGGMPLDMNKSIAEGRIDSTTPMSFSLKLPPTSAGFLAQFLPAIRAMEGRVSVDASATGTLEKPLMNGGMALEISMLRFRESDIPGVDNLKGDLRFSGNELRFQRFTGEVAGGPFAVTGLLWLEKIVDPTLDLRVQSQGTLLVRNDTMTLRANTDLTIAGPFSAAQVTGKMGFTKSRFFREVEILPIGLPGRPAPKPDNGWFRLSTDVNPFSNWNFDVTIQTDEPFSVKGNLANGSIAGTLHLGGKGLSPTLAGTAHVENFVASLPFSRLTVDHGALYFSGNEPLNPTLDIHGSSHIRDYNVNVYLYGTASEPQTLFTSEPSLPQEEIVALLATGATTRDFAQNNQALAGRAAVLLFQDLYHKAFPRRSAPDGSNPMDKFSLDVGGVDPRTGKQELKGELKLSNEFQIGAGVDMQGDMRMQLQYLLRFR